MQSNRKGFTLMEVLIVVLIIAILSAVAVPQYQKAVMKSRYSAMMPIGKAIANGNEAYYMEKGQYATSPTELDVAGKDNYDDGTDVTLEANPEYLSYVRVANSDKVPNARYVVYQKHSANFADTTMCEAKDDTAKELCQRLGGVFVSEHGTQSGWSSYLLSGEARTGDSFEVPCPDNSTACDDSGKATGCNNGYYISEGACAACPENSTCNSNTGALTGCVPGYYVEGGACIAQETTSLWCDSGDGRCRNKNYTGSGLMCQGPDRACAGSTFSGMGAYCNAGLNYTCFNTTYTGLQSYCSGNGNSKGCANSTFYGGSFCEAMKSSTCNDTKYVPNEGGFLGCCLRSNCPIGTPKCKSGQWGAAIWNDENQAYEQDGWWGDCCNPASVGGVENCGSTPVCS